jgi:hypothetical protein
VFSRRRQLSSEPPTAGLLVRLRHCLCQRYHNEELAATAIELRTVGTILTEYLNKVPDALRESELPVRPEQARQSCRLRGGRSHSIRSATLDFNHQ